MPGARKCSETRQSVRQRPDTLELEVLSVDLRTQQQEQEHEHEQQQQQPEQERKQQEPEHWPASVAQQTAATTRRSRWFNFASKSRRRRLLRCEEEQMQLAVEQEQEVEQQQVRLAQPETMNIGNSTLTIASPAAIHTKPALTSTTTASSHLTDSFYSLANADAGDPPKAAIDVEQQYKEQPPSKPRLSMLQRFSSWRRSAPESLPSRRHSRLQSGELDSQPPLSASASVSARNLRRLSQLRRRRSSYYFSGKWGRRSCQ